MTELFLVRHGQGGATPEAYDELSSLGRIQALKLGHWLLGQQRRFQQTVVGQMRRQRETLEAIREVYADAGQPLPEALVLPGLDEYRFAELVRAFAEIQPTHPEVALVRQRPTDKRLWISLLRTTLTAWMRAELNSIGETYVQFQQRTAGALAQIEAALAQGPVLAVSSGGVMSQIAQRVLAYSDATAIDINLSLVNTAVCEYRLSRSGLKLLSLNTVGHLASPADRELITLV